MGAADEPGVLLKTQRVTPREIERSRENKAPPHAAMLLFYHPDGARIVAIHPGIPVVVGRMAPSDVTLRDESLSRQHARFSLIDGEVVVEDLGSTNGTLMGGKPIERAVLGPGDEVMLGVVTVTLHKGSGDRSPSSRDLSSHEHFRSALESEVQRARFFERRLAVLFVGARVGTHDHVRFWLPRVQAVLRPIDRIGLYSNEAILVLMPEAGLDDAVRTARALVAAGGQEHPLVCGVACYPESATYAEALLGVSHNAALRAAPGESIVVAQEEDKTRAAIASETIPPQEAKSPVAESAVMRDLLKTAMRVAKGSIPVLLLGETGTGKEVLARFIHESSPRRQKPLISVNCAAIPASLLESTLFGHEKGAFTGASAQQKGVFESANGGEVFLDEIGELPLPAQAALLRVLETKMFTRVGSTKEITVDVRVIAATHRNLEEMVAEGRFRQDLLFRLNTLTLSIPPLRDRREDIPPLSKRFLEQANVANASDVRNIDPIALQLLQEYSWPGNVRELKNAIERAVVIAQGNTLTVDDLPERVRSASWVVPSPAPHSGTPLAQAVATLEGDFRTRMERLEIEVLMHALRETAWNQTEAARLLQMPLRTLVYKIKVHGIRKPADARKSIPG